MGREQKYTEAMRGERREERRGEEGREKGTVIIEGKE